MGKTLISKVIKPEGTVKFWNFTRKAGGNFTVTFITPDFALANQVEKLICRALGKEGPWYSRVARWFEIKQRTSPDQAIPSTPCMTKSQAVTSMERLK